MRPMVILGVLCLTLMGCADIRAPEAVSAKEYAQVRDELLDIERREDPRAALTRLREILKERPRIVSICHALVHEVGNEAYRLYGGFPQTMRYLDDVCNAGYMHGVIEEMFADDPSALASMPDLCEIYPDGSLSAWQCQHGIGHGLMFAYENDLPKALEGCGNLSDEAARDSCRNGAFMENFSVDDAIHRSRYVSLETPRFPCADQSERDKGNCYVYAPAYFLGKNPGEYVDALRWCLNSETDWQGMCISGVGSEVMKQNVDDADVVQATCKRAGIFERACMAGAIDLAMRHYGNLEDSLAFCDQLRRTNRDFCREMTEKGKGMFE